MGKFKYKIFSIRRAIEELEKIQNINSINLKYWEETFKPDIAISNLKEIKSKLTKIIISNLIILDININDDIEIHFSEVEDPTIISNKKLNLKNTILNFFNFFNLPKILKVRIIYTIE